MTLPEQRVQRPMSDQIFTWAIYALFGAAFSAWEASRPARKDQQVGTVLRREIPWTALVFVNETLVITFYALCLPLVFNDAVMAAIASTGVHDLPMWVRFVAFFLLFRAVFLLGAPLHAHPQWLALPPLPSPCPSISSF